MLTKKQTTPTTPTSSLPTSEVEAPEATQPTVQNIFDMILDWQTDLKHAIPEHADVQDLSKVLVVYACFKALWQQICTISNEVVATRKGMVAFLSIDMEYLEGLHRFLTCWRNIKPNSLLASYVNRDNFEKQLKNVESYLLSPDTYNPIFVRNNCTEANKIYVSTFSNWDNAKIDTSREIKIIKPEDVAAYLPELLSWRKAEQANEDEKAREPFLPVIAQCMFPENDRANRIYTLYNERFAKYKVGKDGDAFSKLIKLVLGTIPMQIQADLSELALYDAYVLYFFAHLQKQKGESWYKTLQQAMGNALVVFHMNREPAAFDYCWEDKPKLNSNNCAKIKNKCVKKWEELSYRQRWADSDNLDNINVGSEADFSTENNNLSRIETLRLQFNHSCKNQGNAHEDQVNEVDEDNQTDHADEMTKSYALLADFIVSYDKLGKDEGDYAFERAVNRFYAIDWQIIDFLLNFGHDTKQLKENRNNNALLSELQNVIKAITDQETDQAQAPDQTDGAKTALLTQVSSICERLLGPNKDKQSISPEESATLLSFIKQYKNDIQNNSQKLLPFLQGKAKITQSGRYEDLTVALSSIILDVLSSLKTDLAIESDNASLLDSAYLQELTLKIDFPFDACQEQEKGYVLALMFFSMMYGPLLRELGAIQIGEKPLFTVQLEKANTATTATKDEAKVGTKASKNKVKASAKSVSTEDLDLNCFADWYAAYNQDNGSWWNPATSSKSISLSCTAYLTFAFLEQSEADKANKRKPVEFSQKFTWDFNKQSISNGLFLDVSHLLGIANINDFARFKQNYESITTTDKTDTNAKNTANAAKVAEVADKDTVLALNNVLRHAYFRYNRCGIKGEYHALSLDDTETLLAVEEDADNDKKSADTGYFISFTKPAAKTQSTKTSNVVASNVANGNQAVLDLDLFKFIEDTDKHLPNDSKFVLVKQCLARIKTALNEFAVSYRKTLWLFLRGQLNWEQVKSCAHDYEQLLKICCDAYNEAYEKRQDNHQANCITQILFSVLRIGIADESVADESNEKLLLYKHIAIACPWHIEGLKTIALKNKRVADFVRSICAIRLATTQATRLTLEQGQQALQDQATPHVVLQPTASQELEQKQLFNARIKLSSCNFELFGKEGLIKLLQSPTSLELVLSLNSDYSSHAFLYRTQCCQGYALYERSKLFTQKEQSLGDFQTSPILAEEMKVIREQFTQLISNFESTKNELNILFWQCPNSNLPLELFCSCLKQGAEGKDNAELIKAFTPYHRVSFYVVCGENKDSEQKLRLMYESRLRAFWSVNQEHERQYIINNKFSIVVTSQDWLNQICAMQTAHDEQLFDLCLCYDIFSANACDYNKSSMQLYSYQKTEAEGGNADDLLVSDERFFPAFYNYQSFKAQVQNQCFLISPFYTNTLKQTLRAFNVLIKGSAEGLAVPYISNEMNDAFNALIQPQINKLYTCSRLVVTCDRLLSRRRFNLYLGSNSCTDYFDDKSLVFHFKQESSIGRNISISAKDDTIYKQMMSNLKHLLEKDISFTDDKQLEALQEQIYKEAQQLSGSIMLKAHQHSYICNEMVGLVLSQYIIKQFMEQVISLHPWEGGKQYFMGPETLMVDDYVRFFGLDTSSMADILSIEIIEQTVNDANQVLPYKVICFVAESKFYRTLRPKTIEDSCKQLKSTATSLAHNFSCQDEAEGIIYYDRELFRQRFAELFFERVFNPEKLNSSGFGEKIKEFVKGNFETEIYAISCCFGYDQTDEENNNILFKCFEKTEGCSGTQDTRLGGVKLKQAVLRVEGSYIKELLELFADRGISSNKFFNNLLLKVRKYDKNAEQEFRRFGLESISS